MSEETLQTIQKAWKTGHSIVITVPRTIQELQNIENGDYVSVKWLFTKKNDKNYSKKIIKEEEDEEDEYNHRGFFG